MYFFYFFLETNSFCFLINIDTDISTRRIEQLFCFKNSNEQKIIFFLKWIWYIKEQIKKKPEKFFFFFGMYVVDGSDKQQSSGLDLV